MSKTIPPVKPYFPPEDIRQIKNDIEKILQSGMLTMHTYTEEFEKRFASLCKVKYAIALNSGTSALEIALRIMKLKTGDEVLVPTNTFTSTAATVLFAEGKVTFADIDPETLCINAENVQEYMTQKTKGIIVVHVGGLICPDIEAIKETCEDHKLFLIEDAAHAQGSTINGKPAGSLSDIGCFSFYPTKVMTTGEGGMIATNDDQTDKEARILRDQGKENFHSSIIIRLGYNWRLPEINAAIGIVQLKRLPEIIDKRRKIAQYYDKKLRQFSEIKPLKVPPNILNNYYKHVAFLEPEINRDKLKQDLREKGVQCGGEVYWPPLHLQPAYQKLLGTKEGDYPASEDACRRMLCLPIHSWMTIEDAEYVIEMLSASLSEA